MAWNPNPNLGNNVIAGSIVNSPTKGTSSSYPVSRFDGIRKLIVLEWTPLDQNGSFANPIRVPFLINPEAIDWGIQHSYSQQQTRAGWVHTHWGDKPLSIKIRGNSGNFEYYKINLLRYMFAVSGKSYLEIKAMQQNKGGDTNRFLSENLGQQDAAALQKLLNDTTLSGQGFFKDFLNNSALYQHVSTVGKQAFLPLTTAISLGISNQAISGVVTNLNTIKQNILQQSANNSAITGASSTLKGGITTQSTTPLTDTQLNSTMSQLTPVAAGRLTASIGNFDPNATIVDPALTVNKSLTSTGVQTSTLSSDQFIASPAGILNSGVGAANTNNYNLLQGFINLNQFSYLQNSSAAINNFASSYLRLENPLQANPEGLSSNLSTIRSYLNYGGQLEGQIAQVISALDLTDDIRNKSAQLNSQINQLSHDIKNLEDEIIVLQREIRIASQKRDTHLEAKKYKKIKTKVDGITTQFLTLLSTKGQLDSLLITPLAASEADIKNGRTLFLQDNTQAALAQLNQIYPNQTAVTNDPDAFRKKVNDLASKDPGWAQLIKSYKLTTNGAVDILDPSQSQLLSVDDPKNFYLVTKENQIASASKPAYLQGGDLGQLVLDGQKIIDIKSGTNSTTTAGPVTQPTLDMSTNQQESIQRLIGGQNNYSIFDTKNFIVKPQLPDIVKLRLYYNGSIFEGFMTDFNWHETAGTPNITYDFEFLVEREFLGASLDNVPTIIKGNSGSTKSYSNYRAGEFNPALGNIDFNPRSSYSQPNTTPIQVNSAISGSAPIGSQRPNPYPAPGTTTAIGTSPGVNNPNNKVNATTGNFNTTSDPTNLVDSVLNELSQTLQT